VNGEHRPARLKEPVPGVEGLFQEGHERRLPVVRVKDVGREAETLADLENRATEVREPQRLVGVVGVERRPSIEAGAVDEVDRCFGTGKLRGEESEGHRLPQQPDLDGPAEETKSVPGAIDLGLERHEDARLLAELRKSFGKRERHVGEPPRFGERRHLGGEKRDTNRLHGAGSIIFPAPPW